MSNRWQQSANRILKRLGSPLVFVEYETAQDRRTGERSGAVATGLSVTARAALVPLEESLDAGIERGDQMLICEAAPFDGLSPMGRLWRVTIDGVEHQLSPMQAYGRSRPDEPPAFYESTLQLGARRSG